MKKTIKRNNIWRGYDLNARVEYWKITEYDSISYEVNSKMYEEIIAKIDNLEYLDMYRKDNELHIIKFNNGNIIEKIYYFKDLEKLKSIAYGYKEYKDRVFNSINKQELVTASFEELLNNIEKDIEDKIINYLADTPDEEDLRIIDGHIASLDEDLSRSLKLEKF